MLVGMDHVRDDRQRHGGAPCGGTAERERGRRRPAQDRDEDKRRVMRLAQDEFRHEAEALKIPIHVAPLTESALMETFEKGGVAIVLVSGYRMVRRNIPHWIFAFGRDGRHVLVHDPAAVRDEAGKAVSAETYAIPSSEFDRMTRYGRDDLRAAIVIRKGRLQ